MGVETKRYIRKPLYVDAVRITTENFEEIAAWCDGKIQKGEVPPGSGKEKTYIKVQVVKPMNVRQTMAFVGDWILLQNETYKIYTNKAFKLAFDLVEETQLVSPSNAKEAPEQERRAQEKKEPLPPQPRRVGANVEIRDDRPKEEPQESPEMKEARETIEADGGTVEPATPEAIAEVVEEQQPPEEAIEVEDSPTAPPVEEDEDRPIAEETPIAPPPTPAIVPPEPEHAGKRVLSEHEQRVLGPDEVRNMVRSGDVVLAQDLAEAP